MIDMEQTISDDALALAAKVIEMDSETIENQLTEATQNPINAHRLAELQQKISMKDIETGEKVKELTKEEAMKAYVAQMEEQETQMDNMMKDRMEMQRLMSSGGSEEQQKALMLRIVME